MTGKVVDVYLNKIERELYGMSAKDKSAILVELDRHIRDKALDVAKELGLEEPTEEIYVRVVRDVGQPVDIAKEYMKVSMKEHELEATTTREETVTGQGMPYLAGAVSFLLGIFFISLEEVHSGSFGTVKARPFAPLGLALMILGSLAIGFARWIIPSKADRSALIQGERKMIYLGGALMIIMGLFFSAMQSIWSNGHGAVEISHPLLPFGVTLMCTGALTIGYGHWVFPSRAARRGPIELNMRQKMIFLGGVMAILLGISCAFVQNITDYGGGRHATSYPLLPLGIALISLGAMAIAYAIWIHRSGTQE